MPRRKIFVVAANWGSGTVSSSIFKTRKQAEKSTEYKEAYSSKISEFKLEIKDNKIVNIEGNINLEEDEE